MHKNIVMKKNIFTSSALALLISSFPAIGRTNTPKVDASLSVPISQTANLSTEWSYDTVKNLVLSLLREYSTFPEEEIFMDGALGDMGLSSYDIFCLCLDCNDVFGIDLNISYVIEFGMSITVQQFVDLVYCEYTK